MKTLQDYDVISVIGSGVFGTCYKVRDKDTCEIFAWKGVEYDELSDTKKESLISEINILRQVQHPNIVQYYHYLVNYETQTVFIVMEYCEGGDLARLIDKCIVQRKRFDERYIWRVLYQVSKALQVCHNKLKKGTVLHRDIKPANIFLDAKGNVKLGDFGLARFLRKNENFAETFVGTPHYMSPEIVKGSKYDRKSDVWALGCLVYELCALKPPFNGRRFEQLSRNIASGRFSRISDCYSTDMRDMISFMLAVDNEHRPNINVITRHPLLARNVCDLAEVFPSLISRGSSNNDASKRHLNFATDIKRTVEVIPRPESINLSKSFDNSEAESMVELNTAAPRYDLQQGGYSSNPDLNWNPILVDKADIFTYKLQSESCTRTNGLVQSQIDNIYATTVSTGTAFLSKDCTSTFSTPQHRTAATPVLKLISSSHAEDESLQKNENVPLTKLRLVNQNPTFPRNADIPVYTLEGCITSHRDNHVQNTHIKQVPHIFEHKLPHPQNNIRSQIAHISVQQPEDRADCPADSYSQSKNTPQVTNFSIKKSEDPISNKNSAHLQNQHNPQVAHISKGKSEYVTSSRLSSHSQNEDVPRDKSESDASCQSSGHPIKEIISKTKKFSKQKSEDRRSSQADCCPEIAYNPKVRNYSVQKLEYCESHQDNDYPQNEHVPQLLSKEKLSARTSTQVEGQQQNKNLLQIKNCSKRKSGNYSSTKADRRLQNGKAPEMKHMSKQKPKVCPSCPVEGHPQNEKFSKTMCVSIQNCEDCIPTQVDRHPQSEHIPQLRHAPKKKFDACTSTRGDGYSQNESSPKMTNSFKQKSDDLKSPQVDGCPKKDSVPQMSEDCTNQGDDHQKNKNITKIRNFSDQTFEDFTQTQAESHPRSEHVPQMKQQWDDYTSNQSHDHPQNENITKTKNFSEQTFEDSTPTQADSHPRNEHVPQMKQKPQVYTSNQSHDHPQNENITKKKIFSEQTFEDSTPTQAESHPRNEHVPQMKQNPESYTWNQSHDHPQNENIIKMRNFSDQTFEDFTQTQAESHPRSEHVPQMNQKWDDYTSNQSHDRPQNEIITKTKNFSEQTFEDSTPTQADSHPRNEYVPQMKQKPQLYTSNQSHDHPQNENITKKKIFSEQTFEDSTPTQAERHSRREHVPQMKQNPEDYTSNQSHDHPQNENITKMRNFSRQTFEDSTPMQAGDHSRNEHVPQMKQKRGDYTSNQSHDHPQNENITKKKNFSEQTFEASAPTQADNHSRNEHVPQMKQKPEDYTSNQSHDHPQNENVTKINCSQQTFENFTPTQADSHPQNEHVPQMKQKSEDYMTNQSHDHPQNENIREMRNFSEQTFETSAPTQADNHLRNEHAPQMKQKSEDYMTNQSHDHPQNENITKMRNFSEQTIEDSTPIRADDHLQNEHTPQIRHIFEQKSEDCISPQADHSPNERSPQIRNVVVAQTNQTDGHSINKDILTGHPGLEVFAIQRNDQSPSKGIFSRDDGSEVGIPNNARDHTQARNERTEHSEAHEQISVIIPPQDSHLSKDNFSQNDNVHPKPEEYPRLGVFPIKSDDQSQYKDIALPNVTSKVVAQLNTSTKLLHQEAHRPVPILNSSQTENVFRHNLSQEDDISIGVQNPNTLSLKSKFPQKGNLFGQNLSPESDGFLYASGPSKKDSTLIKKESYISTKSSINLSSNLKAEEVSTPTCGSNNSYNKCILLNLKAATCDEAAHQCSPNSRSAITTLNKPKSICRLVSISTPELHDKTSQEDEAEQNQPGISTSSPSTMTQNIFEVALRSRLLAIRAQESFLKQKANNLIEWEQKLNEREKRIVQREQHLRTRILNKARNRSRISPILRSSSPRTVAFNACDDTYCSIESNDADVVPTIAKIQPPLPVPPKPSSKRVSFKSPKKFTKYDIENFPPGATRRIISNKDSLQGSVSSKTSEESDSSRGQKRKSFLSIFSRNKPPKGKPSVLVGQQDAKPLEDTVDNCPTSKLCTRWTEENKRVAFEMLAAMNAASGNLGGSNTGLVDLGKSRQSMRERGGSLKRAHLFRRSTAVHSSQGSDGNGTRIIL